MGRKPKQKMKIVVPPITFKEFEKLFKPVENLTEVVDGVKTYKGVLFTNHIRLPGYHIDVFNAIFPVVQVNIKENTIKIWGTCGPKTKIFDDDLVDEPESQREYHWENQWFRVGPLYSIKGWLSELPSPDKL